MASQERKALIGEIQTKRGGSRLICCLTSDRENVQGQFAKDFLFRFFQHLRSTDKVEKLDIFLFTLGGDTLAAYALSRFLRQFSDKISVLVPHMCLSAGTLFALGADEIVMTRLATLSAIDPSILGQLNPIVEVAPGPGIQPQRVPVPVAVESVAGFKKLACDEWRLGEEGKALAFRLLAEKVNPLLLGDVQRSKEQIVRLATNLLKLHEKDPDRITRLVETLATRLGSHDYLIGPPEAREIQLKIAAEDRELEALILRLYEDFAVDMELGVPFDPAREALTAMQQQRSTPSITIKRVMIESFDRADTWEQEFRFIPPNQMQIVRNGWIS